MKNFLTDWKNDCKLLNRMNFERVDWVYLDYYKLAIRSKGRPRPPPPEHGEMRKDEVAVARARDKKMKVAALVVLCIVLNKGCLAFQSSSNVRRPDNLLMTSKKIHQDGQHDTGDADVADVPDHGISRRSVISVGATAALFVASSISTPSLAIVGGAQSSARVESWPGIESLEPLYEFKLSIDAVVTGVQDPSNWPFIQKRLETFFGGFIINEKNYFMGVGLQYMNDMKYDEAELPNYVLLDKEARFNALDSTMKNLESLKLALADSGGSNNKADIVIDLANSAQSSLQSFFALIPEQDIKAVEDLFKNVKKADTNGDGRLSDDEIIFLSPNEQEIWKKRINKFG